MPGFSFKPSGYKPLPPPAVQITHYHLNYWVYSWEISSRIAPFWYVYWNETPGARLIFGSRTVELTPDRIVVIPPLTLYSTSADKPFLHSFFYFRTPNDFFIKAHREIVLPAKEFIPAFKTTYQCREDFVLGMYALTYRLLCLVSKEFSLSGERQLDERIVRVLEFISTHEKRECANLELSRIACMSVSGFNHTFAKLIGKTPQQYVQCFFLEKARIILENPRTSIDDAAEAAGFSDRYSFSHAYKKYFSIPPGKDRKQ